MGFRFRGIGPVPESHMLWPSSSPCLRTLGPKYILLWHMDPEGLCTIAADVVAKLDGQAT